MRPSLPLAALILALTATAAQAQGEAPVTTPVIHSHRGGSVLDGKDSFAEETMPAFRNAALVERTWLEFDVKLTKDRVPVVLHDDTLDRTTVCKGGVITRTMAELAACPTDILGSPGSSFGAGTPTAQREPLPRLDDVLRFAKEVGASVNIELKNQPGDADYDPTDAFAETVMATIKAAAIDPQRLIVQSFDPHNLDAAARILPGVQTSFLTLAQANEGGPGFAASRGYDWISPGAVPSPEFVQEARALGLRVIPYTLNKAADVQAAAKAGVDALITDDPAMARRALGRPEPLPPAAGEPASPLSPPAPPVTAPPAKKGRAVLLARYRSAVRFNRGLGVRLEGPKGNYLLRVTPFGRSGPTLAYASVIKKRGVDRRVHVRLTASGRRAVRSAKPLKVVLRYVAAGRSGAKATTLE